MSEDTDHIDLKECHRRGIEVVTLPKMSTDTVSTLTMAILRQTLEGIDRYFVDRIFPEIILARIQKIMNWIPDTR